MLSMNTCLKTEASTSLNPLQESTYASTGCFRTTLLISHPYRYLYDILRVLEYFDVAKIPYDRKMQPALDWLKSKQKDDRCWYLENIHKGNTHFEMEIKGKPSRFITLKALFILRWFEGNEKRNVSPIRSDGPLRFL